MELREKISLKRMQRRRLRLLKKSLNSVKIRYQPSKKQIIEWINQIVSKLKANYQIVHLSLFGSYVKNNYGIGSDVDLLVIHTDDELTFETVLTIALEVSSQIDWEIHLYHLSDFKTMLKNKNRFITTILTENMEFFTTAIIDDLKSSYLN